SVGSGEKALLYLGRYLYKGVILEKDIIACENGQVTFRYRNSKARQLEHRTVLQGSPVSPILSNILLDDLDKELEKRGHKFIRYADDLAIFVKSKRAGERVMVSISL
ncbi:MAG: hypothetical protein GY703_19770, partial [Gammaproteobacteria bacterium]|nr:hypothetical protein [Gammaproteobacteria bacterium]